MTQQAMTTARVDLLSRKAFFAVLEEFGIEQQTIAERTIILREYDPDHYTAVDQGNISRFKNSDRDFRGITMESIVAALLFEPTDAAFNRFFELFAGGFDMGIAAKAMRHWESIDL